MRRELTLVATLALTACGTEQGFIEELPLQPSGDPLPLESTEHTDILIQTVTPSVDILYMIDNSCSMGDDQAFLSENAPVFMRWFIGSGLDYHIGVVSSDTRDPNHQGKLQKGFGEKWITSKSLNQVPMFQQMAVLGNGGASPEKGLDGIYLGIEVEGNRYNSGFLRDSSALHTICVSDEDDFSNIIPVGEFINWYDGLKRTADERTFSAIENPNPGASGSGQKYSQVTRVIGGITYNIRSEDWSPALDRLGLQATGRKTEYFLSRAPVPETIIVEIYQPLPGGDFNIIQYEEAELDARGDVISGDWYYTSGRNSITFAEIVPDDLAQVHITYTLASAVQDERNDAGNGG